MSDTSEINFIRNLVIPELEAEGYKVYMQPTPPILPSFFGTLRPDAIAVGANKNVAIEVVGGGQPAALRSPSFAEVLKQHSDWTLRVYVIQPEPSSNEFPIQSEAQIRDYLGRAKKLIASDDLGAALLVGWGTFEALARRTMTGSFTRPQSPARIVQLLAQEGFVTPTEADHLRYLGQKRNAFVHGMLDATVTKSDLETFVGIMSKLVNEAHQS